MVVINLSSVAVGESNTPPSAAQWHCYLASSMLERRYSCLGLLSLIAVVSSLGKDAERGQSMMAFAGYASLTACSRRLILNEERQQCLHWMGNSKPGIAGLDEHIKPRKRLQNRNWIIAQSRRGCSRGQMKRMRGEERLPIYLLLPLRVNFVGRSSIFT